MPVMEDPLREGNIVVLEEKRIRVRRLPLGRRELSRKHFDCAAWLYKARQRTKEDFKEVEQN